METTTPNKIAMAALTALLCIFGGRTLIDGFVHKPALEKAAYALPMAPPSGAASTGGATEGFDFKKIAALLPKANAEAGQDGFKKCAACHVGEKGGANKVGPALYGVIGRPIGQHEGFTYSDAMKAKSGNWGWEQLAAYIYDPKNAIPGNKMAFAGVKDDADLADILAYMRKLSDAPVALPP